MYHHPHPSHTTGPSDYPLNERLVRVCPKCGGPMEEGVLIGGIHPIKWRNAAAMLGYYSAVPLAARPNSITRLLRRVLLPDTTLRAMRCPKCLLGVFAYDRYVRLRPAHIELAFSFFAGLYFLAFGIAMFLLGRWGLSKKP